MSEMPKIDDQGWFPYGVHADVTGAEQLGREIADDYGLDEQAAGFIKEILGEANICCWVTHAADAACSEEYSIDPKSAYISLPAFIGFGTLHASDLRLEDLLATAVDISHAGPDAQLIALQNLQRTVYQYIEQTRDQIAESGAKLGRCL